MTLVLLPGMDGTGELFRPFLEVASKSRNCVAVRYPGKALAGLGDYISVIKKVLPQNDDYILVAESFSGPLAIEIASQEKLPPGLCGVVLCASFVNCPIPPAVAPFARAFGRFVMRLPTSRWAIRTFLLERNSSDDLVDLVASAIKSVDGDVLWSRLSMLLRCSWLRNERRIQLPCIALLSERDRLVCKTAQRSLVEAIGDRNIKRINGPHLLMQTRPEEVWKAIEDFANSLNR